MPAGVPVGTLAIGTAGATNAGCSRPPSWHSRTSAGRPAGRLARRQDRGRGRDPPRPGRNGGRTSVTIPPGGTIGILGGGQLGRHDRHGGEPARLQDGHPRTRERGAGRRCRLEAHPSPLRRRGGRRRLIPRSMSSPSNGRTSRSRPWSASPGTGRSSRPRVLEITQDRLAEKSFLRDQGIETAPSPGSTTWGRSRRRLPGSAPIRSSRTRRLGYDGKGQIRLDADSSPKGRMRR
jgi:5-(carboxyamino)imidazole ribonucleotide synthase